MGLRFRKSISLFPGVKLNFGKTGMSVSTGVPGFKKTFHSSGKVTTTIGIPGTGIYYTDTKTTKHINNTSVTTNYANTNYSNSNEDTSDSLSNATDDTTVKKIIPKIKQVSIESLKSIHKVSDDSIDWTEVLVSETAPDETYNQDMWKYYHDIAPKILSGDIDAYLQLIYEVNPLNDLLEYGGNYEFGTDNPQLIEVEFTLNDESLLSAKSTLNTEEYEILFQDFIASVCIRIARDMFALLPVNNTIVHAVIDNKIITEVNFDRKTLSTVKFGFIDPSETLSLFKY